jgi:hypothetical protein
MRADQAGNISQMAHARAARDQRKLGDLADVDAACSTA